MLSRCQAPAAKLCRCKAERWPATCPAQANHNPLHAQWSFCGKCLLALKSQPILSMRGRSSKRDSRQSAHPNGVSSPTLLPVAPDDTAASQPQPAANAATTTTPNTATLLVQCQDRQGVVAALAQLLYGFGCNIVESEQFTDKGTDTFFQRICFDFTDLMVGSGNVTVLERAVDELAKRYGMEWRIAYATQRKRVAILVSKLGHCLYDLLIRHRAGELACDFPVVISNHQDLEHIAQMFDVPFKHLPMQGKGTEAKLAQEAQIEALMEEMDIDLLVLARYMQIFTPEFCARHSMHTLNIHHSFLPAFEGAKPYHRAHTRGVKVIGATAHYATSELDAGPIVEQDVTRISHRDNVDDMIRRGRDLERVVLARALRAVVQDRVFVQGNRTVVFAE